MNYALEQRLRFIDFIVTEFNFFNRSHVQKYFGIGTAQATRDIKKYMELAPDNIQYNPKFRVYSKMQTFKPLFNNELSE